MCDLQCYQKLSGKDALRYPKNKLTKVEIAEKLRFDHWKDSQGNIVTIKPVKLTPLNPDAVANRDVTGIALLKETANDREDIIGELFEELELGEQNIIDGFNLIHIMHKKGVRVCELLKIAQRSASPHLKNLALRQIIARSVKYVIRQTVSIGVEDLSISHVKEPLNSNDADYIDFCISNSSIIDKIASLLSTIFQDPKHLDFSIEPNYRSQLTASGSNVSSKLRLLTPDTEQESDTDVELTWRNLSIWSRVNFGPDAEIQPAVLQSLYCLPILQEACDSLGIQLNPNLEVDFDSPYPITANMLQVRPLVKTVSYGVKLIDFLRDLATNLEEKGCICQRDVWYRAGGVERRHASVILRIVVEISQLIHGEESIQAIKARIALAKQLELRHMEVQIAKNKIPSPFSL